MLSLTPVNGLEYYRTQDKQSRKENLQYHTDNEQIERGHSEFGEWLTISEPGAEPLAAGIVDGGKVDWKTIDALSRFVDPATGERFEGGSKSTKAAHVAAQDLTWSAPKDVSVLHAVGRIGAHKGGENAELFQFIADVSKDGHEFGVRAGMKCLHDDEAFQVRYGQGGRERAKVQYMAGAMFTHYTSRDGDMQLHSHVVMPSPARGPDGSVRAWDNYKVNSYIHKASAVYRAEMLSYIKTRLAERGIQIHASKDGKNFRIDGVPDNVKQHFSKRRTAVLKEMYKATGSTDTAHNRRAAQIASYATRRDKNELPPIEELYARWEFELNTLDHSIGSLIENIHTTAQMAEKVKDEEWAKTRAEAAQEGVILPAKRPDRDLEAITKNAVGNITQMDSTFERRKFEETLLEHLQVSCNAATALALVEQVKAEREYVQVGVKGRAKEAVFTDTMTLNEEFELLDIERRLQNNVKAFDRETVEKVISSGIPKNDGSGESFQLRDEQKELVRHLTGPSQITNGVGDPGTGKTTSMIKVREAAEVLGFDVHILAPTNKAVDVLRKELGLPVERGYSAARFLYNYHQGKLQLGPGDVVILDEAGMVSRKDMLALNRVMEATGARFMRVGDPKQLPPVEAGAPFRSSIEAYGAARLKEITRQNDEWARQASKDMSAANVQDAVMAYADRGFVHVEADGEDAIEKMAKLYFEQRERHGPKGAVTTTRNMDVRRLNNKLTERKIEMGILKGSAYEIEGMKRGADNETHTFVIMEGSRILLGENVMFQDERYANNSLGTVEKVADDEGYQPDVTVLWDDGRRTTFKPSQFVGFREDDDKFKDVPKLALGDCMTRHASQGVTLDWNIDGIMVATPTADALVGWTRHKKELNIVVDGGRIESDLSRKQGKTFTMGADGSSRQEDDVPDAEITRDMILSKLIEEVERSNSKANACDLLGGPRKFLEQYRADYESGFTLRQDLTPAEIKKEAAETAPAKTAEKNREGAMTKTEENARKEAEKAPLPASWRNRGVRGLGMTGGQLAEQRAAQAEAKAKEHVERRLSNPVKPETTLKKPTETNYKPNRFATQKELWTKWGLRKAELDYIGQKSLLDFARSNYAGELKEVGREMIGGIDSTWFQQSNGARLAIGQQPNGMWTFVRRDRSAKGSIFAFVSHMDGCSDESAAQKLQSYYNTKDIKNQTGDRLPSSNSRAEGVKAPQAVQPERKLTVKEHILAARASVATIAKDVYAPFKERFERMRVGFNEILAARGITRETQAKFHGDIRTEWSKSPSNPNGIAFPHRDADGTITSYERKGTKLKPDDKRSFSQMAGDGRKDNDPEKVSGKRLGMIGNRVDPERIYVAESQIDGLSLYQIDREAAKAGKGEAVPEKVLLLSTYGNPSYAGLSDLALLAERNPMAEIHVAMDNDNAGRILSGLVNEAVKVGRGDDAQTIERRCDPQFKDWNTQLMMKRDPEQIAAVWSQTQSGASGYLSKEGITVETQKQFRDDIRLEGAQGIDGKNVRGVLIAMRDQHGHQTGYMRYGVERDITTAREFRRAHSAQQNDLIRIGQQEGAQRVYFGQSAIDTLKVYERDGRPAQSLLVAAEGGFNERQKEAISEIARANPSAQWSIIPDATRDFHEDTQRDVQETHIRMTEAVTEANPYAKVQEVEAPEPQGHYWREIEAQEKAAQQPEAPTPDQKAENAQQPQEEAAKVEESQKAADRSQDADRGAEQGEKAADMEAAQREVQEAQQAAEAAAARIEVQETRQQRPEDPEQGYGM